MLIRAALVTLCLLAGAAAIGRASSTEPVLLRQPLAALPLALEEWRGREAGAFDARTLEVLGVDEYVHRAYSTAAAPPVFLYVGYYGSQRHGDTMHSPLNCLPGAGWQPVSQARSTVDVSARLGGSTHAIAVNDFVIERGEDRQVVLYWYQSQGRVEPSEYRSKVWTVLGAMRSGRTDGAIVRITSPIRGDFGAARERAMDFARALYPHLHAYLPE